MPCDFDYAASLAAHRDYYGDPLDLVDSLNQETFIRGNGEIGVDFGGLPVCLFVGNRAQASFSIDRDRFVS